MVMSQVGIAVLCVEERRSDVCLDLLDSTHWHTCIQLPANIILAWNHSQENDKSTVAGGLKSTIS